jgi:hypothetical protein
VLVVPLALAAATTRGATAGGLTALMAMEPHLPPSGFDADEAGFHGESTGRDKRGLGLGLAVAVAAIKDFSDFTAEIWI